MNILMDSWYQFPARGSAGAERIVERFCRGMVKLNHKVYLKAKPGSVTDTGAIVVDSIPDDTDIIHKHGFELEKQHEYQSWGKPWVASIYGGGMENDPIWLKNIQNNDHLICQSTFVANRLGSKAIVYGSSSEEESIFIEQKQNYFLYLASFGWGFQKGLDTFINLAKKMRRFDFYIAGAGGEPNFTQYVKALCQSEPNIKFIGEVNGAAKAQAIANAKAMIVPTKLHESCPTTISEALMCGTPVIGSAIGPMTELIPPGVGFTCDKEADYVKAILNIDKIKPEACRKFALDNYSDLSTAKKCLTYYENMLTYGKVGGL